MMPADDSKHWAKIQKEMDSMGAMHTKNSAKQAREMMSDMDYSHCQHEASESPAYEKMEERAVKMMRSKMKPGGSY
jgi:hypothetical protein